MGRLYVLARLPIIRVMGLRLVLGITLLCLLVVVGAKAYGEQHVWEATGATEQGEPIWFGFGPDGRPAAFDTHVMTDCTWEGGSRRLNWWQGEAVVPFVGQGKKLRAAQTIKDVAGDGSDYVGRWKLEAEVGDDEITGTVRIHEVWTLDGEPNGHCWTRPLEFTVPLG